MPKPLADRIALVTGASRGIGYAQPRSRFAKAGAHVVAVARTLGGARGTRRRDPSPAAAPRWCRSICKDYDGIDRLGAALYERCGRLDVLVGNAGMLGPLSPLGHVEPKVVGRRDGGQRHRQLAADPLARSAAAPVRRRPRRLRHLGRRVDARSAYWGPYSVSKAALELLARTYAAETATTNLRVNIWSIPARCAPACARPRCRARIR